MSDTPNTDAAIQMMIVGEWVPAEFARQLERELARREELLTHYTYAAPQVSPAQDSRESDGKGSATPAVAAPDVRHAGPNGFDFGSRAHYVLEKQLHDRLFLDVGILASYMPPEKDAIGDAAYQRLKDYFRPPPATGGRIEGEPNG